MNVLPCLASALLRDPTSSLLPPLTFSDTFAIGGCRGSCIRLLPVYRLDT